MYVYIHPPQLFVTIWQILIKLFKNIMALEPPILSLVLPNILSSITNMATVKTCEMRVTVMPLYVISWNLFWYIYKKSAACKVIN
jgi:hypothetical protein